MASIGAIRNAAFSTSIHMRAGSARLGANANIGARRGFAGHGHDVSDVRRNYSLVIIINVDIIYRDYCSHSVSCYTDTPTMTL
jgi:hypothetical protein